jgi:O-antigen/teichoic acid export membrane protein
MRPMINNKPESVTQKAVGAIKWSALMEVMPRAISSIVFLLLVRLLTPEDFGVMSAAMTVIGFSQIFWDIGLGKALIQTKEKPEKAANVVFWTNLLFGIVVYKGLLIMAPWLVAFFDSPASISVFRILGLQIVIDSLASVQ